MATRISNTNAFIKIKQITVSKEKAFVTFLVFANEPEKRLDNNDNQKALLFFIQDLNEQGKELSFRPLSRNYYWLNYFSLGTKTEANNVDLNLYKEITFEIDITNFNTSKIVNNRWVRTCKFKIQNYSAEADPKPIVWSSETINLISDEIVIPTIIGTKVYSLDTDKADTDLEKIVIEMMFKYESQYDFNYVNNNIEFVFQLLSNVNNKIIRINDIDMSAIVTDSGKYDENNEVGIVKYTFEGKFNNVLKVRTAIRTKDGSIVKDNIRLYKPQKARNPIFVKRADGGIEKVSATFNKK